MQTQSKILDDFAKLITNAAGAAHGVKQEVEVIIRQQMERLMSDLDLVTREEFEAVRTMAANAREENDALAARLAELEAKLEKASK
jgi:BMFP domain-containing protein YqiC